MRINSVYGTAAGALLIASLHATAANAQATRTWVSGVGDDVNPCSRTAPCKTFAGAISKTAQNGEINCLDPAGYGAVTITKSITLNCHYTHGSILNSGTNGIVINITNAADPLKSVRLVGLDINGPSSGTRGGLNGISILAATNVFIENVRIDNNTQNGINDTRTGTAGLSINNVTIRNNTGVGLRIVGTAVNAQVNGLRSLGNSNGIAITSGNELVVTNSVLSGNTAAGIDAGAGAVVSLDGSDVAHNAVGIIVAGGGTVRISNNNFGFNGSAFSGATASFGNNRVAGTLGTAPTPAGADSLDKGQQ